MFILCPILFVFYISDLSNSVTNWKSTLFADDFTLYFNDIDIILLENIMIHSQCIAINVNR